MRLITSLLIFLGVLPSIVLAEGDPLESMVASELDFARLSVDQGIGTAFPSFAAEGAVVFRPEPTDLTSWLAAHPAPDSSLDWRPEFAGMAASGDLGWTSGPWRLETGVEGETVHGTYLTVWRRQPDGSWRWAIDIGISHPEQEGAPTELTVLEPTGWVPEAPADVKATETRLFMADRLLGVATEKQGRFTAYDDWGDPALRLLRPGSPPVVGLDPSLEVLGETESVENWRTQGGGISDATDLGYTYGFVHAVENRGASRPTTGYYMRIWRRDAEGPWKVLFDVELPATVR